MKKYCSTKMDPKAFEFGRDATGPGPAAYGIKTTVGWQNRMPNIAKGPAYTFKQVLKVDDATESPGPKYNLERLTRHGKQAVPKFYMGLNLPEIPDEASPGPAAYMVQNMRSRAKPKILLPLPRLDSKAEQPGPNQYKLKSTLSGKAVSLAKKIEVVNDPDSPGPAVYKPVPTSKYLNRSPRYTLAKKFEDPLVANEYKSQAPGPQAYKPSPDYKYKRSPKYSFGMRRPDKFVPLIICGDDVKK